MRKFLLLMIALLAGVSGTWAADYTVHYKTKSAGAADPNGTFYNDGSANTNAWSNAWVSKLNSTETTIAGLMITSTGKNLSGWNAYLLNGEFTIAAPYGYQLKSYTLKAKRYDEDGTYEKTITPEGKATTTLNASTDETIEVTSINARTAKFTVAGTNDGKSRVIVSDLSITVENVAGSTYLLRFKDTDQYLYGTGFKKRTDREVCLTITATGSLDYDGYPTYKIQNPSGQYAKYSAASKSSSGTDNKLSWDAADANNVYTIMYRGLNDYVRIKVARETEDANREDTYWTGWNNNNDAQVVFWNATDNLSNWQLIPVKPVSSLANINRNKCYVVKTAERGNWAVAASGTQLTRNLAPSLTIAFSTTDKKQQFAFVKHDESYYLYSVSEKKFLSAAGTANNSVINLGRKGTQSVSFVSTGVTAYPVCIEMSNTADLNVRNDSGEPGVVVYGISGQWMTDGGNAVVLYEVGDFDPTEAENTFNVRDVTYELYYNNSKVADQLVTDEPLGEAVIPAELDNGFMTYTYTPATITAETATVRVDATWNGPFEISPSFAEAKWYMVDMHSNVGKYTWQYESSNEQIYTPVIGVTEFTKISEKNLFCFVGDPYNGFKIYNKSAGSGKTLRKETAGESVSVMSTTDDHNLFKPYTSRAIDGACCFKLDGDNYYLNNQEISGVWKIVGYDDNDAGSSCRFFASGQYYYDALSPLVLDAPVGVVGTKSGIIDTDGRDALATVKTALASDVFAVPSVSYPYAGLNPIIDAVVNSDMITLGAGYYRVVSAVPGFNLEAAWYYNPSVSSTHIVWAKAATTSEHQINSLFKFTTNSDKWNIYSPNAQQYITEGNGTWNSQNAKLGSAEGLTVTSIGSAQYTFLQKSNAQTLHAQGHSDGSGSNGNLVTWNSNNPGEASTWYVCPVSSVDIPLNNVGGYSYGTMYLPFGVTLSGAKAYILTVSGEWAIPTEIEQVPANTGVLIRAEGNVASATATINDAATADTGDNELVGTFVDITTDREAGEYILGNGDAGIGFYMRKSGKKIGANKAYLNLGADLGSGAVKGIRWDIVDGIEAVTNGQQPMVNSQIFNLAGQRMSKLQRGVNIVNGKKVLVK